MPEAPCKLEWLIEWYRKRGYEFHPGETMGAEAPTETASDGKAVTRTAVKMTVPAAFTASETFDVGTDLGSTASRDYYERRPFKVDGTIGAVNVALK